MKNEKKLKTLSELALVVLAALIIAATLHVFVYSNSFSPSGMSGIATMLQEVTKINAGVYTLSLNIPVLVFAWVAFDKKFVLYSVLFIFLTSAFIYLLAKINFYQYMAASERLLAAIFSGVFLGVGTGIMIKVGGSTGGTDIIACAIQRKNSHINIERIISVTNYIIIFVSIFVYKDLNSVLLSLVQMYILEWGVNLILKDSRDAVEFKIVTKHVGELREKIMTQLKHGATIINSRGLFTGD
ncbi:MAG: YitT family protein, partial [Clostridia bacterium]|nr:YitT family protein [Clostridia bacterium]